MKAWQQTLIGVFVGLLCSAAILLIAIPPRGQPIMLTPRATPGLLMVYVTGAVLEPGVYQLPPESHVLDAVKAAGGLLPSADSELINLAAKIQDGSKIDVKEIHQNSAAEVSIEGNDQNTDEPEKSVTISASTPLDINTATVEELDALPGIGTAKAQAIIDFREQNGQFVKVDDIQNVPGIGTGIYEKIKSLICIN